jgi:tRNA G18 (ribose-2'-O)-methylase SpoU
MQGYFGMGIYHPKTETNIGTLVRSAFAFGANFVFTVGRRYSQRQASDTPNVREQIPLFHYKDLEDLHSHLPHGCMLIGVELNERAYLLPNYSHPRRACYLLGAEDYGLPPAALDFCHQTVIIPKTAHCLNVSAAGSIVLYDRSLKATFKRSDGVCSPSDINQTQESR